MANIVATNTGSTVALNTRDRLYVPETVGVIVAGGIGVQASGVQHLTLVTVDGSVVSLSYFGIFLGSDGNGFGGHTLIVGGAGVVRTIDTRSSSAIYMNGSDSAFQNWGEVTGTWGALLDDFDDGSVVNHGVIAGEWGGLSFSSSDDAHVVNSGQISGFHGIQIYNASIALENSGAITATGATGNAVNATNATDSIVLHNSGTLSAMGTAVALDDYSDLVSNTGTVRGDIRMAGGQDIYSGASGVVHGRVYGGAGDDQLRGGDAIDALLGEAGNDVLLGRGGDDQLTGGGGSDLLRGGNDDDTLSGGKGADQLFGQNGDDGLSAHAGNDTLRGGRGDDLLSGGSGKDILDGGRDDDRLTGGTGADVFVFARNAGDDTITDFANGTDKIDLTDFGLRAASFASTVGKALSNAGGGDTLLDLGALGGQGSVLIEGLPRAQAGASDFIF